MAAFSHANSSEQPVAHTELRFTTNKKKTKTRKNEKETRLGLSVDNRDATSSIHPFLRLDASEIGEGEMKN